MNKTIKAPRTVRELGELADELGLKLTEMLDVLEEVHGANWWKKNPDDLEDFILSDGPAAGTTED